MPLPAELTAGIEWVAEGVGLVRPAAGHAGANSILLTDGGDVVLVDAGLDPARRRLLAPHVDVCFLTHCHVPHAHGAREFNEVWAPRLEAAAMQSVEDYLHTYGVSRRDHDLVATSIRKSGYEASPVHRKFRPGGILKLGKREWRILATPGHSPGMVALLDDERHIMFAADLDGERPPWYGYPSSDPSDLERTAGMLAEVPVALLITSHGEPRKRGIKPLFRGMAEAIRVRDQKLLSSLELPKGLDELAGLDVWGAPPTTPLERYHQRIMVEKHLARLMERDFAAARQDGRFQRLA